MQATAKKRTAQEIINDGSNNGLGKIRDFIKKEFKVKAKDYFAEMHRIDAAVKAEFPTLSKLSKRYNLLYVLSVFRHVIYHRDDLPIRLIGHLYEALVIVLVNGKTVIADEDIYSWVEKAQSAGFRGATYRKITEVYDGLVKKPGSNFKPRGKTSKGKKTLDDAIFKILTTESSFAGWKTKEIDLELLRAKVNEAEVEYDLVEINIETISKAVSRLKRRTLHEHHTRAQPKAQHRIRK